MNLHISKSKNAESFYICKSYVKANGSTSSMIVRKLGTLEQLLIERGSTRDDILTWVKNKMKINWDNSYSFDAEDITYSVEIAKDYLFQDVIYTQDGLLIPETELELPEAGQYFIRVRATNEKGKTQDAFDYYVTDEGKQYGMRCIYVTEDGQIEEDIYEE